MHKWFSPVSPNEYIGILISYAFCICHNRNLHIIYGTGDCCPLREAGNLLHRGGQLVDTGYVLFRSNVAAAIGPFSLCHSQLCSP
jgi:hypothetical protein